MARSTAATTSLDSRFIRKVLFVPGIVVAMALLWKLAMALLLAVASVIITVLVRSLADPIRDRTGLSTGLSIALAAVAILEVLSGAGWLLGSTISAQVAILADRLPASVAEVETRIATLPFGSQLANRLDGAGSASSLGRCQLPSDVVPLGKPVRRISSSATDELPLDSRHRHRLLP